MTQSSTSRFRALNSSAASCAWNVGLLYLGMMLGHQCSVDNASYLSQCYVTFVALIAILSIFSWLDIISWLRRTFLSTIVAENRPKDNTLVCESPDTCQKVVPTAVSPLHDNPSESSTFSRRGFSISSCRRLRQDNDIVVEAVLSSQELFASNEDAANLTVRDITAIFRYALEVNRKDFDRTIFTSSLSTQANNVLTSMDVAVSASRGSNVDLGQVSVSDSILSSSGHMDVLYFLAAVRIFADWRCARFVPDGHRRYAMSVSLGRRDLVQNIGKVERAVHAWIEATQLKCGPDSEASDLDDNDQHLISPTIEQLLQHELDTGVHKKLPNVTEASAGNGLLWILRQLLYHTSMVRKSLQVPSTYSTTRAAVEAAYEEVYGSYHGWTTQQIFRRSLRGAPEFSEILKLLEEDQKDHQSPNTIGLLQSCATPVDHPRINTSDRAIQNIGTPEPSSPVENFVDGLLVEWSKAVAHLSRFNCHEFSNQKSPVSGPLFLDFDLGQKERSPLSFKAPMRTESDVSDNTEDLTASSSDSEESCPVSFLEQDLADHGKELAEVLQGLQVLISAKNMNDPGKV